MYKLLFVEVGMVMTSAPPTGHENILFSNSEQQFAVSHITQINEAVTMAGADQIKMGSHRRK